MRVGLGVTTYNRPELLEKCLRQINRHTFMDDVTIYVAKDTDSDRKGVAYRKNECLRALKDCDHIILLDDDCYPIKDGWIEFLISSKQNHLLYLNHTHNKIGRFKDIDIYKDCGGVMLYLTKEVINKVGAFNEEFIRWGLEHCEYSLRIFKAGLTPAAYMMKKGTDKYFYALDYDSKIIHQSTINNFEKNLLFNINRVIFAKPITEIYRAL